MKYFKIFSHLLMVFAGFCLGSQFDMYQCAAIFLVVASSHIFGLINNC